MLTKSYPPRDSFPRADAAAERGVCVVDAAVDDGHDDAAALFVCGHGLLRRAVTRIQCVRCDFEVRMHGAHVRQLRDRCDRLSLRDLDVHSMKCPEELATDARPRRDRSRGGTFDGCEVIAERANALEYADVPDADTCRAAGGSLN